MSSQTTSGRLHVVGIGPGDPLQMTPEAALAISEADAVFGYASYLDRLTLRADQTPFASDNREELDRASAALQQAAAGARIAVVSGGDPGIFAMAAAVCEAIERGPPDWRDIELAVMPGVTAMLAVAACVGAPLGHDFCAMSLSDNLKPWDVVERRLAAAAEAGFVLALYNPVSRARPWQLGRALEILEQRLPRTTPVVFGRAAGRADERIEIVPLSRAATIAADMATCIIVGSAETRLVERANRKPLVYTPRSHRPALDREASA